MPPDINKDEFVSTLNKICEQNKTHNIHTRDTIRQYCCFYIQNAGPGRAEGVGTFVNMP